MYTLVDSYEWNHGYSVKYGLFATNFSNPTLTRRPKASSILYAQVRTTCRLIKNMTYQLFPALFTIYYIYNVYIHVLCKRQFMKCIMKSLYGLKWMKAVLHCFLFFLVT